MGLESSGVYQQSVTFWSVTLQPLGAYRYTIPHMKGDIHSFNMRYNSMTCTKRLQRYSFWNCLIGPSLVKGVVPSPSETTAAVLKLDDLSLAKVRVWGTIQIALVRT